MTNKPPFAGEGARRVRLGDIASVKAGNVAPKKGLFSERGIPFVRAGSLSRLLDGESPRSLERIDKMTADKLGMQLFPEGTILFAKSGMSCMTGNVYVLKEPCYVVSHLACVAIDNTELTLYLKHYFRWNKPNALVENPSFPSIRLGKIKDMEIRLPDARQIARWVSTLERIEGLMETHEHQLSLLDDLVKSRFVEMFEKSASLKMVRLKDVCSVITDGTHQSPKFQSEGVPFLFVSNIANNELTYETSKYISLDDYETLIKRTPIEIGDILVSAVGSFGHPAIVKDERPFCFQRHIAYLKPRQEKVNSVFLHSALLSDGAQRYMDSAAKGVAQRTVTLNSFKELVIPLPPLSLQREFAAFAVEVDKSRVVVQKQIERLQTLYDSLAQEYFG